MRLHRPLGDQPAAAVQTPHGEPVAALIRRSQHCGVDPVLGGQRFYSVAAEGLRIVRGSDCGGCRGVLGLSARDSAYMGHAVAASLSRFTYAARLSAVMKPRRPMETFV